MEHQNQSTNVNQNNHQELQEQHQVSSEAITVMINGEEVVVDLKGLKQVLNSAPIDFPENNQVFKHYLSKILDKKEGSQYQLEISQSDYAQETIQLLKNYQYFLGEVQSSFRSYMSKKDFDCGFAVLEFLSSKEILEELRKHQTLVDDPLNRTDHQIIKAYNEKKVFQANCRRIIHYLIDFRADSQSEQEKLVSCYIFNICHRLSSFYQIDESLKYCDEQELLQKVWMHSYQISEENRLQVVKKFVREFSELTEYERSSMSGQSEEDEPNAHVYQSTAVNSQNLPEENKQSEDSASLFSGEGLVLQVEKLILFLKGVKNISGELENAHQLLRKILFEKKDKTQRLLCLKFNFTQNKKVAILLEKLKVELSKVNKSSIFIQDLGIFGEGSFGSSQEVLEQFLDQKILDQISNCSKTKTELEKHKHLKNHEAILKGALASIQDFKEACTSIMHHLVDFDFESPSEGDQKMSYFVFKLGHYLSIKGNSKFFPEQELFQTIWMHSYKVKTPTDVLRTVKKFEERFEEDLNYHTEEGEYVEQNDQNQEDQLLQ